MSRSKAYKSMKESAPKEVATIDEAITFLQKNTRKSFDETIELHIHLGVKADKSDQLVRGSIQLPHGTPKQKTIAVITDDKALAEAAKKAGAGIAGGQEVIADIEANGSINADVIIATPKMMGQIAKVAKVLGPKGLMPNPKNGTVTEDPAAVVKELAGGKVSFKMDNTGNIHESVAKASWDAEKISENTSTLLDAVKAARPAAQKGTYLKSITLTSTMSPAVRIAA